jgi:hypothetical protein
MTVMAQAPAGVAPVARAGSLYDTLELILDKGIVIDASIRVSLIGIELLRVEIRVVIASVDTYLRFAQAINQMELTQKQQRDELRQRSILDALTDTPLVNGDEPVTSQPRTRVRTGSRTS